MSLLLQSPVLAVIIPLLFFVVIYMVERRSWRLRNALAVLAPLASFVFLASNYSRVLAGERVLIEFPAILPPLGMSFSVDYLSLLVGLVVTGVWFWSLSTLRNTWSRYMPKTAIIPSLPLSLIHI